MTPPVAERRRVPWAWLVGAAALGLLGWNWLGGMAAMRRMGDAADGEAVGRRVGDDPW